jgi:4-hydroxy-4-methyl-2-oxoglutarate aldolase
VTVDLTGSIDLDDLARRTFSAVFSDICDQIGLRNQALPPTITARTNRDLTLIGWARPVQSAAIGHIPDSPYANEIAYVDSLRPGDVVVADCGGSTSAFWGELFSTAALGRGARGAVVNGGIRDLDRIPPGFAIRSICTDPSDSLGRLSVVRQDSPIVIGKVSISMGDLVVSDADGTVIVPREVVSEVIPRAIQKASIESAALGMLTEGALLADVWDRHRVL